ncbi:MAG: guanine deaminase [Gammaproteobacteria bacterium]|nr:guanine deaminase [Gammaproteobacteria bacterium]
MSPTPQALLGDLLWFVDDPAESDEACEFIPSGLVLIEDGHISATGRADQLLHTLPADTQVHDHRGCLITPGFIDTHVHYPQCEIIASYGTRLLEWLETYTFPGEAKFSDAEHARTTTEFFLNELIRNGTTTALVFGTVHPQSVDQFFTEARKRNLRMICGKVMMDRNAPDGLLDTAQSSYEESLELFKRWHGQSRLGYAITPRFAPTSTDEQLQLAGQLKTEFPDAYVHTHLAENPEECRWVKELFPQCRDYVDVYDHFGLLGSRSIFAHAIHLQDREWERLAATRSSVAHCPTSNLFIGSGLFNLKKACEFGVSVGVGTDVGGGDSFSILRTLNEAYKIQQLQEHSLSPLRALYLATLGGARALDLDRQIGTFGVGAEADIVVLNPSATPLLTMRTASCKSLEELLFALVMLGDDRTISHTYVMGQEQKSGLNTQTILHD